MGWLSACLIQQEHKGPATVVCTLETLKELFGRFRGVKVRVCTVRGVTVCNVCKRHRAVVETAGEVFGMKWPNCGSRYGKI